MSRSQVRQLTGETFGQRLREARLNAGLTQENAARLLDVTLRTWQRWEAGESQPPGSQLVVMAARLGVSAADLHPTPESAA